MITDRDIEIFKFINIFGKSYIEVLGMTYFKTVQGARNRMNILSKQGLITYRNTGVMSPRRAIFLTSEVKNLLEDMGIEPKIGKLNVSTIRHGYIEQLAYFYLSKIGEVERTTVATHARFLNHVPDLIFTNSAGLKIYIEVELNKKSQRRYSEIFELMKKDAPAGIVYILEDKDTLSSFMKSLPVQAWEKLRFIDIDTLIENVECKGAIHGLRLTES